MLNISTFDTTNDSSILPLGRPAIPEAPGGRGAGPIFRDAEASTER